MEMEYRTGDFQVEKDENKIKGYAVVYNSRSEPLNIGRFEFVEEIKPGAFDEILSEKRDIKCLFNHDKNQVLGRTTNDTLQLRSDDHGLYFECEIDPEISWQSDLFKSIKRGDINQCSFAFNVDEKGVKETTVEEGDKIRNLREINKVSNLYEVSVVTFPAYKQTEAYARNCEEFVKEYEQKAQERDKQEREKQIEITKTMLML